ncbi:hypothetical protein Droror1_Dr00000444 [Drosera rotundifolia]
MEGSESKAVFESLNLYPQRFTDEVYNCVADLVDSAFGFFHQKAANIVKADEGTERSAELKKGTDGLHHLIQATFDNKFARWEKYCLEHCFAVPSGFSLSDPNELTDFRMEDVLGDEILDGQLVSLRNKLAEVSKESDELDQQLRTWERQSFLSKHVDTRVNEVLQLYEENNVAFQELVGVASELRSRMENLNTNMLLEDEQNRRARVYRAMEDDLPLLNSNKGLFGARLEDLEAFLADMKNV